MIYRASICLQSKSGLILFLQMISPRIKGVLLFPIFVYLFKYFSSWPNLIYRFKCIEIIFINLIKFCNKIFLLMRSLSSKLSIRNFPIPLALKRYSLSALYSQQIKANTYFNDNSSLAQSEFQTNWMSKLNNHQLVSHLSIPGTHDSGTFDCKQQQQFCSLSQCQSWNTYTQLLSGLRYLDLRIDVNLDGSLGIGHGPISFMTLDEALIDVSRFLKRYPSQFVILAFQRNSGFGDPSKGIVQALKKNSIESVFKGAGEKPILPTVQQLRGKAWIFAGLNIEFPENPTFVMNGVQGNQGITNLPYIYLQNYYKVRDDTIKLKVEKVKDTAFNIPIIDHRMKINFMSGTGGVFSPNPKALAKKIGGPNQVIDSLLKPNAKRFLGVTLMDYPGTSLIKGVIDSNFEI